MEKLRVGMAGAGGITRSVLRDLSRSQMVRVDAIASRSAERSAEYAARFGIPRAYGSYEELAADPEIDLVYIGTTNPFHLEQAKLMMDHGKHVLCEKPMGINTAETEEMIATARKNGVFLMEAMWTRFLPCYRRAMDMIRGGNLGEIMHAEASFSFMTPYNPESRLFDPKNGGGALLDVGVYTLSACTDIFQAEPEQLQAMARLTPEGVDRAMSFQMQYASGATAHCFIGMDADSDDGLTVSGTRGCLDMKGFWHGTGFTASLRDQPSVTYAYGPDQASYHYEFDHVADCIRQGKTESDVMPLSETLRVCRVSTKLRSQVGVRYPFE